MPARPEHEARPEHATGPGQGAGPQHGAGPLAALLARVAAGDYPPSDGRVTILPQPSVRDCGVLSFTAHAVIFADADPAWVRAQLPDGDLAAPMSPRFLQALCARTGRRASTVDMLCLASPMPGPPAFSLSPAMVSSHPRASRAVQHRDDVRAWEADGGIVVVGRGVAGRWEVAIEVDPGRRGQGLGRELAAAARHLISNEAGNGRDIRDRRGGRDRMDARSERLWAQISLGNAASVRAFLAAGYEPVGAEALLTQPGH